MKKSDWENAIAASTELKSYEVAVLWAWALRCDYDTGENVRSSLGEVAKRAKVSRRRVIDVTNGLISKGWLEVVEKKDRKETVYRLAVPSATDSTSDDSEADLLVQPTSLPSETDSTSLVKSAAPTSDAGITQYTYTPKTKEDSAAGAAGPEDSPSLNEEEEISFSKVVDESGVPLSFATKMVPTKVEEDEDVEWDDVSRDELVTPPSLNIEEVTAAADRLGLDDEMRALVMDPKWQPHRKDPIPRCAWARDTVKDERLQAKKAGWAK